MGTNRRDFLRGAAAAGGLLALHGILPRRAWAKDLPPGTWFGNRPGACHDVVREAKVVPKVAPEASYDVVIAGGGLAGLCAAYRLRDTKMLLLEHLERTGGHAVREAWEGISYSACAAYFVEPEPPLDSLYAELALPMRRIQEPSDSAILQWNAVTDAFGEGIERLPYPEAVRKEFRRAREDFIRIGESDDCPVMPLAETSDASKAFDRWTFADWMTKQQRYHPAVKRYVDLCCRSAFGAPSAEQLSAFAGLNFYVSEFTPRYTFPGGNALAAEILRERVEQAGAGRLRTDASVVSVRQEGTKSIVTYVDGERRFRAVEARVVVMATPKYVTQHLVQGLPKAQSDAMGLLGWGSYVVANVLCSSAVTDGSYDTWIDTTPFTDVIVADWVDRGADGKPKTAKQVLTVYWPVAYQHASIEQDAQLPLFREALVDHLEGLWPGAASKVVDVRCHRWGHALHHGAPGWYTNLSEVARAPFGQVLFAHSDNQGLPAFEAALVEGMTAATAARDLLA